MTRKYKKPAPEWWTPRRLEIARRMVGGEDIAQIRNEKDPGTGKKLFTNIPELYRVKAAVLKGDSPFDASSTTNRTDGDKDVSANTKNPDNGGGNNTPHGPAFIGQIRPRTVVLDDRMFLLYDLAKERFPEYQMTEGEWIWDCVLGYYLDHAEDLGASALFQNIREEKQHDNRQEILAPVGGAKEQ